MKRSNGMILLLCAVLWLSVPALAEETAAAGAEAVEVIELSTYLGEDIAALTAQVPTLANAGASDAQEYSNEFMIVSAPWNAPEINYISLQAQAPGFSIYGLQIGAELEDAVNLFLNDGWTETDRTGTFYEFHKAALEMDIWSLDGSFQVTQMALKIN